MKEIKSKSATWFEVVANVVREEKKVTERYIVDALSATEAEARVIEELDGTECNTVSCKRTKIREVAIDPLVEESRLYRSKISINDIDEKTGKIKSTSCLFIVQADNFQEAVDNTKQIMNGTMADWEIKTINETNIVEVIY